MIHECKRCNGWGGICKCGRSRQLIRRQKACPSCGTRAMSQPCPGFVAGVIVKARWPHPTDTLPTADQPHFATFATCDCCGIRANGFGASLPPTWHRVPKGPRPELHLCEACHAHHELLVTMALEQLFVERERANVGLAWQPANAPKLLHPMPPRWLRCDGCGHDFGGCQPLWAEQRKCCPDCTHGTAPDSFIRNVTRVTYFADAAQALRDGTISFDGDFQPVEAVEVFAGVRVHTDETMRGDQIRVFQGTSALLTIDGVNLPMGFIPFDGPDDALREEHALQLVEDIEADAARIVEGINAPPGAD